MTKGVSNVPFFVIFIQERCVKLIKTDSKDLLSEKIYIFNKFSF